MTMMAVSESVNDGGGGSRRRIAQGLNRSQLGNPMPAKNALIKRLVLLLLKALTEMPQEPSFFDVPLMATVKHKILVLSAKGGVGKSAFSAQLSFAWLWISRWVSLISIFVVQASQKMLGLEGQKIYQSNFGWSPAYVESNLGVMSIGFVLPRPDEALDILVVDAPPGTSDEPISIVQFLQETGVDGAIIVTTPQQVSLIDVRKEVSFCKEVALLVLGVVENMSGLCQPLPEFKFLSVAEAGEQKDMT
ncbi:cytosolic Fe-S cluster assembly factor NBP35 [Olea europaea subsp. europaea]|uniref:Cytosolic Fe-S cluster assembly factor NBP35 n=1 Tax=Olea europaea subsp. europaea TaxID=158383 RepID=A0A8S0RJA0_OLEEU|nr:cytosolic Fe-S cluster assembly factor NBP35 [Olea europaea subsp. europaea]